MGLKILLSELSCWLKHRYTWLSSALCRICSGCLELPVRRTAWTAVNCEQFQTVT